MGEISRFLSNPPTGAKLNQAKYARIQSLPGMFETDGYISSLIGPIFLYHRPLDYFATLPAKYQAVSAYDVARVAKDDLHPKQLIIVAARDRARIEKQLKDADLGPVEVRDIGGNLVVDDKK